MKDLQGGTGGRLSQIIDERIAREMKNLVSIFQVSLKNARIFGLNNEAFLRPLRKFLETLNSLLPLEGELSLRLADSYLFVNEQRIRFDIEGFLSYTRLVEDLKGHKIGSVVFRETITGEELREFISLFLALDVNCENPSQILQEQLLQRGISRIYVEGLSAPRFTTTKADSRGRELAKVTFLKAITSIRRVLNQASASERIDMKGSKRVVQSLVDLILGEDLFILGLTSIKNYDDYTANHSVNVAILSLALGSRLGYSKSQLFKLGMAAFFHDIGKVRIPEELINKPSSLEKDEFKIVALHPYYGVLPLMRLKGFNDLVLQSMIASFEHHLNYDLSGYPPLSRKRKLTLFSRIIRIADSFDAMTTARVYRPDPFHPDQALAIMMNEGGRVYDPYLAKVFVNTVGIYPRGTLLLFDTKEVGMVVEVSPHPELIHLPQVEILRNGEGRKAEGEIVDLTSENQGRRIVRSVFPRELGINIIEYLWR
jgi:HD-GYP domain-containing protein (c-di-GMP phosphodiesterase class II)